MPCVSHRFDVQRNPAKQLRCCLHSRREQYSKQIFALKYGSEVDHHSDKSLATQAGQDSNGAAKYHPEEVGQPQKRQIENNKKKLFVQNILFIDWRRKSTTETHSLAMPTGFSLVVDVSKAKAELLALPLFFAPLERRTEIINCFTRSRARMKKK